MTKYKLKTGKIGDHIIDAYKGVEQKFTDTFLIEDENSTSGYTLKVGAVGESVVGTYQKIEDGVVGAYKKVEKKFVDTFLEEIDTEE